MTDEQTPPEGFEPQPDLQPGQKPVLEERPSDLIADAEAELPNADPSTGQADGGDDSVDDQ